MEGLLLVCDGRVKGVFQFFIFKLLLISIITLVEQKHNFEFLITKEQ